MVRASATSWLVRASGTVGCNIALPVVSVTAVLMLKKIKHAATPAAGSAVLPNREFGARRATGVPAG